MKIFGWRNNKSSGFSSSSTAEEVTLGIDGSALTAIITGGSSGIGAETTRVLAMRDVHVIMAVRNVKNGMAVKESLLEQIPNAKIDVMELDLSSLASVKDFASHFISLNIPLNILINNAGVFTTKSMVSKDNIELNFAVNHLGHFLLTNLLLETMKTTAKESNIEGRIINISSTAQSSIKGIPFDEINSSSFYNRHMAYPRSKLANILHANQLAKFFKDEEVNITANSVHPGIIYTNIFRRDALYKVIFGVANKFLLKNVEQGAATTCYVALHPENKGVSGQYFENCKIVDAGSYANDAVLAKQLWDYSLNLCKLNI